METLRVKCKWDVTNNFNYFNFFWKYIKLQQELCIQRVFSLTFYLLIIIEAIA